MLEQEKEEKKMGFIDTETETTPRRPSLLLDVRDYQCSFVRPPAEKRFDPLGRGTSNGGHSLHDESGRDGGLPLPFGKAGTRSELPGGDEPDTFTECCRAAYKCGRFDGVEATLKLFQ